MPFFYFRFCCNKFTAVWHVTHNRKSQKVTIMIIESTKKTFPSQAQKHSCYHRWKPQTFLTTIIFHSILNKQRIEALWTFYLNSVVFVLVLANWKHCRCRIFIICFEIFLCIQYLSRISFLPLALRSSSRNLFKTLSYILLPSIG